MWWEEYEISIINQNYYKAIETNWITNKWNVCSIIEAPDYSQFIELASQQTE